MRSPTWAWLPRALALAWDALGPSADPWLLILSCIISAAGAALASPEPRVDTGLPPILKH